MKVNREIVIDLLPLYMAGEVSQTTRTAVEEYLSQDPDLRARVESARQIRLEEPPLTVPASAEKGALEQTQRLLSWKSWLTGLSIFFTMLPMSFVVRNGKLTFQLARDLPWAALASLIAAMAGWIAFAWICRRLQATGLEPPWTWWRRLGWAGMGFVYGNMAAVVAATMVQWEFLLQTAIVTAIVAVGIGEWLNRSAD
jgi:anti-sigma factor RsiW